MSAGLDRIQIHASNVSTSRIEAGSRLAGRRPQRRPARPTLARLLVGVVDCHDAGQVAAGRRRREPLGPREKLRARASATSPQSIELFERHRGRENVAPAGRRPSAEAVVEAAVTAGMPRA